MHSHGFKRTFTHAYINKYVTYIHTHINHTYLSFVKKFSLSLNLQSSTADGRSFTAPDSVQMQRWYMTWSTSRRPTTSSHKQFKCDIEDCTRSYYAKKNLLRHQTTVHGRVPVYRRTIHRPHFYWTCPVEYQCFFIEYQCFGLRETAARDNREAPNASLSISVLSSEKWLLRITSREPLLLHRVPVHWQREPASEQGTSIHTPELVVFHSGNQLMRTVIKAFCQYRTMYWVQ